MAETQSAHSIAYSRAPFSTWLGIVCLFVLFGLIVLAVIGPSPRTSDYEETRAKKRMEKLKTLREETQKDLTTYAWVDKNKGVARIPIDRAMEVTVADLAQKKPAPAGPIATPAAQTAPPPERRPRLPLRNARRGAACSTERACRGRRPLRSQGAAVSVSPAARRRVASSSNSTITPGARFSRTSHDAMNRRRFNF